MTNYHDNGSQTGAGHWREVMGEERDKDHMVRQGPAGLPAIPVTSPLLVDTSSGGSDLQGLDQTGVSALSFHPRQGSSGTVYTPLPSLPQRILGSSGVGSVPVLPSEQRRLHSPAGHLGTQPPPEQGTPDCQGVHYVSSPSCDQRKPVVFLPPRSPQRSATVTSLALRSPKRTISLDFPTNMDPRKVEELHRHILQVARVAGMSDSVKIVEEHQEEEEDPLPIIQLQDPPKAKFKRQLSADSSPPHRLSAPAAPSHSAQDREHVLQGHMTHPLAEGTRARAPHAPSGLPVIAWGVDGEGQASYTSSAMSPKRLKSEHGAFPCTPPNSPVVSQRTAQGAGDRRGAQSSCRTVTSTQKKQVDVVHIFPQLREGLSDSNNNSADRTKVKEPGATHTASHDGLVEETDARQQHTERNTFSWDIVNVLNVQQPQRTGLLDKDKAPGMSSSQTTCRQQESMHALQMLFGPRGQTMESKKKHPSPTTKDTYCDRQSVRSETESEASTTKQVSTHGADSMSQKPDRPDIMDAHTAEKFSVLSAVPTGTVSSSPHLSISSLSGSSVSQTKTTPKISDDSHTDSDPYMAELAGRLQDMQRMIFSQHATHTGQMSAQKEDTENERSGMILQGQSVDEDRERNSVMSASSVPSALSTRTTVTPDLPTRTSVTADLSTKTSVTPDLSTRTSVTPDLSTRTSVTADLSTKTSVTANLYTKTIVIPDLSTRTSLTPDLSTRTSVTADLSTKTTVSEDRLAEEESRTARLCRSKSNPFTFMSGDIERAKARLPSCEPAGLSTTPGACQGGRESVVCHPDSSAAQEDPQTRAPFKLGDLWISSSREGQVNALMTQRQLSDPGTMPKLNRVLEQVKPATLRQFSEPARPKDPSSRQESGPSKFQKNPKQPGRSLQQQIRFRSENSEGLDKVEGHPSFFLRDEENRANEMIWKNCATSQSQSVFQRSPTDCFEVSRRCQPFDDPSTRERDRRDHYWPTYQHIHFQPSLGEHGVLSSSGTPSPWPLTAKDRVCGSVRQAVEDDSVFEEVSGPDRGSPFKNPAAAVGFTDRYTSPDRSSASRFSAELSPKRPALRSQSNVEQSPNKAELEAMAHYKYLRSFSEHISDPKRLIEQLRAMTPADYQLLEQPQSMRKVTPSASLSSDKDPDRRSPFHWNDRHRGARRTLFQDEGDLSGGGYEVAEWQQQGCYTYPPPLARRQSFSSARDLRRSQSWIRDMDSASHSSVSGSRQPGDLDVTLECQQAIAAVFQPHSEARAATSQHPEILRHKIETYIQQILKNHLQIGPSGTSQADMDRWIAQAEDIERLTQEASQLMGTLSEHNRSVYDVLTGSVVIKVNCSTLPGVFDLWEKFESGALQRLVGELFGGDRLMAVTGLTDVQVHVSLCYLQYTACLQELGGLPGELTPGQSPQRRSQKSDAERPDGESPRVPPSCTRGDVTAGIGTEQGKSVLSWTSSLPLSTKRQSRGTGGDCSPRKAFSELNLSDGELTPTSPTTKFFFDNVQKENSVLSLLASPHILPAPSPRWRTSLIDIMGENYQTEN